MNTIVNKQIKIFKIANRTLRTPAIGTVEQIREIVGNDNNSYYLIGSWGSSSVNLDEDEFIIL
jgi:hypothetical protein